MVWDLQAILSALAIVVATVVTVGTSLMSLRMAGKAIDASASTASITMQATLLKDFKAEFDALMPARLVASAHGKTRVTSEGVVRAELDDVPPEVWQIMDFFDKLAMYLKRGYLDSEMVFISFLFWMLPYWLCFREDVEAMRNEAPLAMWHEIPRQLAYLESLAAQLDVTPDKVADSKAWSQVCDFMKREEEECRSALSSSVERLAPTKKVKAATRSA